MELTHDQLAAAEACGCAFVPATDDHIRRLTVQRRIFRIDGNPHLVTRNGFYETHATMAVLLERHGCSPTRRAVKARVEPISVRAAAPHTSPPVTAASESKTAEPETQQHEATASLAGQSRSRKSRPHPEPRQVMEPISAPDAEPSEAEEMLAESSSASSGGPRTLLVGRRRAGQPKTPRWMVAGKLRRGRL